MDYFPVSIKLSGKTVLFVGVGPKIEPKVRLLSKCSAKLILYAADPHQKIHSSLKDWINTGRVQLCQRLPESVREKVALVYIDSALEEALIQAQCKEWSVPVCVIDNKAQSSFITPALVDRSPITVAIASEGLAPVLVRKLKAQIEDMLPPQTGALARLAGRLRLVATTLESSEDKRAFWTRFFDFFWGRHIPEVADQDLTHLANNFTSTASVPVQEVQFVSAGPGDPELLTRKAANAIHQADVILHDHFVSAGTLELARREAELIKTGKTGYGKSWSQTAINQLLVEKALSGQKVVRLKSGDAAVFARLDQETEALAKAGVAFSVIPGITAACATAAAIGVSLTRRSRNSSVQLITAHDVNGFAELNWRSLAQRGHVAAIYMGKRALPFIQERLLAHGADPNMPVTVAWNTSLPTAHWISAPLHQILAQVHKDDAQGQILILLGLRPAMVRQSNSPCSPKKENILN